MKRETKFGLVLLIIIMTIFMLSSCADTSNVQECLPQTEHTYGFWGGTWHGVIMVPSFIGSIIWDDVAVYAVNNNGAWYDFGFVGGFFFIIRIVTLSLKGYRKTKSE